MSDQRGVTVLEALVTTFVAGMIFVGLSSMYTATTRVMTDAISQASLQRQATLALDELGRRIRGATGPNAVTIATCNGYANSVQVTTADGTFCFYGGASGSADAGRLCEYKLGGGAGCRNLLYGALQPHPSTPMTLLIQPATPDPTCPQGVTAGNACFAAGAPDSSTATFSFAVTDGFAVTSFGITATCKGRDLNC